MAKSRKPKAPPSLPIGFAYALTAFGAIFAVGLISAAASLGSVQPPSAAAQLRDTSTYQQVQAVTQQVQDLEQAETEAKAQVIPSAQLGEQLATIQVDAVAGDYQQAQSLATQLQQTVNAAQLRLSQIAAAAEAAAAAAVPVAPQANAPLDVPILLYHHPPPDFNAQLDQLQAKGYTTIAPDQLADALHHAGQPLPAKPVLITFDDGYADQMSAFDDLVQHHMRATFYIISGGARSRWCIGVDRRFGDPLQPPGGCGDNYLTWDQIKQLDASGLITIGAHTVDHESLPTDPPAIQQFEILTNKQELEVRLGHPVDTFAYPYGAFDTTTLAIVQAAGFRTAVTTNPGLTQTLAGIYTLNRMRAVSQLP